MQSWSISSDNILDHKSRIITQITIPKMVTTLIYLLFRRQAYRQSWKGCSWMGQRGKLWQGPKPMKLQTSAAPGSCKSNKKLEKAVAFTILPGSWDQTKQYCLKNYQIIYKEQYHQKQVWLSFKFGV